MFIHESVIERQDCQQRELLGKTSVLGYFFKTANKVTMRESYTTEMDKYGFLSKLRKNRIMKIHEV